MKKTFPYRYRVLILLFFLIVVTYLDRVCISLVGVRIKSAFNLSNEQFGWVLGAFALAYALFEIPTGVLGDRIGQRKVFIRIVLWWSLFTALTGAVTGLTTLMITRFLFGMGEAGAFPNSSAAVSRWFPATETGRGLSWIVIGTSAGAAVAPLIVIPIAAAYGWRAPFFVNGLIGFVWVLACFLWFRNEPAGMKNISAEEIKLIEENRRLISHEQKFPWKAALKCRSLVALVTAFFTSQWALYFFIAWMPVYLQEGRQFSENAMKITISYLFIVGMIGGLVAGFFSDWLVKKAGLKFSRRFIGSVSLCMPGLLFFISAATSNNTIAAGCLMFGYFFLPFFFINSFSVCIDIGKGRVGTVAGIMNFAGQLGSFLMAIVFGKIVDATHSFNAPLFAIAGVLITGGLVHLAVDPTKQVDTAIERIELNLAL
jgi:ACS family glucarate transporter-like MFS transporter